MFVRPRPTPIHWSQSNCCTGKSYLSFMKGYSLGISEMEKQNFSSLMYSCDHVYLLFFATTTLKCLFPVLEKRSGNILCSVTSGAQERVVTKWPLNLFAFSNRFFFFGGERGLHHLSKAFPTHLRVPAIVNRMYLLWSSCSGSLKLLGYKKN